MLGRRISRTAGRSLRCVATHYGPVRPESPKEPCRLGQRTTSVQPRQLAVPFDHSMQYSKPLWLFARYLF